MGGEQEDAEELAKRAERLRSTRDLRVFLVGHVVLGLSTMGVSIYTLTFDRVLMDFMNEFFGVLEEGYAALWNFFVLIPLFAGMAAIFLAALALKSSSERGLHVLSETATKRVFRGSLIVLTLLFVGQVIFGIGYIVVLDALLTAVESQAVGRADSGLRSLESDISTLQLAAFNLCCEEEGWSAQGSVPPCDANGNPPATCGLASPVDSFSDTLCTCYSNTERYAEYYGTFAESRLICEILAEAVVSVDSGSRIPGTQLPLSAFVPVSAARIVGFNGLPALDFVSAGAPRGYGCGFGGYARAFQWQQFEYMNQKSRYIAVVMIVISCLELALVAGIRCRQVSSDENRFFEDMMDDIETMRKARPDEHLGGDALAEQLGLDAKGGAARRRSVDLRDAAVKKMAGKDKQQPGQITPFTPLPTAGAALPRISVFTMDDARPTTMDSRADDFNDDDDDDGAVAMQRDPSVAF